jgi:hypothetical protein
LLEAQATYLGGLRVHTTLPTPQAAHPEHPMHAAADAIKYFSPNKLQPEDRTKVTLLPFPVVNSQPDTGVNQPPPLQEPHPDVGQGPWELGEVLDSAVLSKLAAWHTRALHCLCHLSSGRTRSYSRPPEPLHFTNEAAFQPRFRGLSFQVQHQPNTPLHNLKVFLLQPFSQLDLPQQDINTNYLLSLTQVCDIKDQQIITQIHTAVEDESEAPLDFLLGFHHLGFQQAIKEAEEDMDHDAAEGWLGEWHSGFFPTLPCHVTPNNMINQGDKWRRCINQSFHFQIDVSMNGCNDLDRLPKVLLVRVTQFARASFILLVTYGAVKFYSADMWSAYRRISKQRSDWWKSCVLSRHGVAMDMRCQFGDAGMVAKFQRLSCVLRQNIQRVITELDTLMPPSSPAVLAAHQQRARALGPSQTTLGWNMLYIDDVLGCSVDDTITVATVPSPSSPSGSITISRPALHLEAILHELSHPAKLALPLKLKQDISDYPPLELQPIDPDIAALSTLRGTAPLLQWWGQQELIPPFSKVQLPSDSIKGLGIHVTTQGIFFDETSRSALASTITEELVQAHSSTPKRVHQLVMQCVWKAQVHVHIRPHLSPIFAWVATHTRRQQSARRRRQQPQVLSQQVKAAAQQVVLDLKHEAVLPLFPRVALPGPMDPGAVVILEDACPSGWGVFMAIGPGYYALGQWLDKELCLHINEQEALTTVFGLRMAGQCCPASKLNNVQLDLAKRPTSTSEMVAYECIDNTTAECNARSNSSRSARPFMQKVLLERSRILQEKALVSVPLRVTTKQNLLADILSRGDEARFLQAATQLGFSPIRLHLHQSARSTDFVFS